MTNAAQQKREVLQSSTPWFETPFAMPENPYSARRPAPVKVLRPPPKPTPLFPLPFRFRKTRNEIVKRHVAKKEVAASAPAPAPLLTPKTEAVFAAWVKRKLYSPEFLLGAIVVSGLTGLCGVIMGGAFAQVGEIIARTGAVGIGMGAGALLGIPYALATDSRKSAGSRSLLEKITWTVQCVAFGAVGGLAGVIAVEIHNDHSFNIAALSGNSAYFAPPPDNSCITAECRVPAVQYVDISMIPQVRASELLPPR